MTRRPVSFPEFVDAILLYGKDVDDFVVISCTPDETYAVGRLVQEFIKNAGDTADATVARRIARVAPMLDERQVAIAVGAHSRRPRIGDVQV